MLSESSCQTVLHDPSFSMWMANCGISCKPLETSEFGQRMFLSLEETLILLGLCSKLDLNGGLRDQEMEVLTNWESMEELNIKERGVN